MAALDQVRRSGFVALCRVGVGHGMSVGSG